MIASRIADNYRRISERIESACRRSGRDPATVRMVAVTKYAQLDWVKALLDLGVTDLGESRPQQLCQRAPLLPQQVDWHLVGQLQRNKVRPVLSIARVIHAVDTLKLLSRINLLAGECQLLPQVLLQVNVSAEASKNGFTPEELASAWNSLPALQHVQIEGLMTMAPRSEDADDARPAFSALRELRTLLLKSQTSLDLPQLSMGMSGDFEVAIEEGATLVRIGSSLFEGLQ